MASRTLTIHRPIAKRCIIALFDLLALVTVAAICSLSLVEDAYAYVDPSVMTYTIQALAGVAVALGAVAGVAFRRSRKAIFKLLKIDENAGKTVEEDVSRIACDDIDAHAVADERARDLTTIKKKEPQKLSWPKRLAFAAVAAFFFTFTLFVATPYELIGGASGSLLFGLAETWQPIAVAGLIIWVVLSLLISLLRGKAFNIAVIFFIGLGLLCYLQALFGNVKLPSANGAAVDWWNYTKVTLLNGFSWLVGIAAIAVFFWKKPTLCRNVLCILAICVAIVEAVGVGSLFTDPGIMDKSSKDTSVYLTEDGLYDISNKSNVIVFVLDTYDVYELDWLMKSNPDMLDEMTGFTYYRNVGGTIAPTRYALPWFLTGEFIQHDETYSHYLSTVYDRSSFLDDLKATGYSLGIYTDTFGVSGAETAAGFAYTTERALNMHPISATTLNAVETVKVMYKASLYRDMPWILKRFFWFYTDEINESMAQSAGSADDPAKTVYVMNDARYYERLQQIGLSVNKDEVGSFRLIHLLGVHIPYTIDENGKQISDGQEVTEDQQGLGVMKMVSEYLKQLKDLGVYDNSYIVITADHGYWFWGDGPDHVLDRPGSPIMLVKPANQGEKQNDPFVYSDAPISQFDLHASIMKAITGDGSKYGTAFDETPEDASRIRYYVHPTHDGTNDYEFIEYEIDGYVLDFNNWHQTGKVWDCTE